MSNSLQENALALIPQIKAIYQDSEVLEQKQQRINTLIERTLTQSTAEKYLGCLIKAFAHLELHRQEISSDFADKLRTFITGDYIISCSNSIGTLQEEATERDIWFGGMNENKLAVWKICEYELEKITGDKEAAKSLAASTAYFMTHTKKKGWEEDSKEKQVRLAASSHLVNALTAVGVNPFSHIHILEFGGHDCALTPQEFPLIRLFGEYKDYTPVQKEVAAVNSTDQCVSVMKPRELARFQKRGAKGKYDYIIACNVFCEGALDYDEGEHLNIGERNLRDLLPNFGNALADQGKLIVANFRCGDGIAPNEYAREKLYPTYGFAVDQELYRSDRVRNYGGDGLYSLRRDYTVRPDIPYTYNEQEKRSRNPDVVAFTERLKGNPPTQRE